MQGVREVEAICERSTLARAEAYMNEHFSDEEPSAEECFGNCVHSDACARVFGLVCHATMTDSMPYALGCADECDEYEDAWCPMSLSGTMRCQGPKRIERENHS